MRILITLFLASLFILSCGTKKRLADADKPIEAEAVPALVDSYVSNVLDYKSLEYTAAMDFEGNGMKLGFNGVFRMTKDEEIWGSFKKFGFEAVRLRITPDSMWVLNRLQKQVIVEPLDRVEKMTGVPLKFQDIEQLLIGGSFMTDKVVMINDSTLTQTQTVNGLIVEAVHNFNRDFEITKSDVDAQEQGNLQIDYADHRTINFTKLAFNRNINAKSNSRAVNLSIQTQNINVEASFETPFDIPASYTRMSL